MAQQTKQKKEIISLVALLVVAALIWYGFVGKNRATVTSVFQGGYSPINVDDYGAVFPSLDETRTADYKSSGRNIFVATPPPPPPSAPTAPAPEPYRNSGPMPPPPPPKPELGMKFFGLGTLPSSGPRRAFLQDGDDVHIVGEGDTVKNHIRITHIGNDRIEYEDVNTGMKNTANLEITPPA